MDEVSWLATIITMTLKDMAPSKRDAPVLASVHGIFLRRRYEREFCQAFLPAITENSAGHGERYTLGRSRVSDRGAEAFRSRRMEFMARDLLAMPLHGYGHGYGHDHGQLQKLLTPCFEVQGKSILSPETRAHSCGGLHPLPQKYRSRVIY